ncbi:hypothetical protein MMC30_006723 [Trapelia coarctata]|nr:hypothetical protein [Trapelia coarctata]
MSSTSPSSQKESPVLEECSLNELRVAIGHQRATFCCGGSIPVVSGQGNHFRQLNPEGEPCASPSVVLRWDVPNDTTIRKVTFPPDSRPGATSAIDDLIRDSTPATFGRQGVDILDESYRKAAKLDNTQFSTNFSPYEFGIVNSVAQVLLPEIAEPFTDGETSFVENLGVIAELYKLNVYSGPSGRFRPHVDTPRSATQFGSLVVSLPHPHQGGQLRVAHKGEERTFDLNSENADAIKWSAFYSDCEHEVLEVQSGHRVTLTYNLYVHEYLGGALRRIPTAHPNSYPLYAKAKDALSENGFMKDGGTLGFYCEHAYAHFDYDSFVRLPFALKGVDMVTFVVFKSLGLHVSIRPVLEDIKADKNVYYDPHDEDPGQRDLGQLVGNRLCRFSWSDDGGYDGDESQGEIVRGFWASDWYKDILWLNGPGPKSPAVAHLTYGNEASMVCHYSFAAMLVTVPPFEERKAGMKSEQGGKTP